MARDVGLKKVPHHATKNNIAADRMGKMSGVKSHVKHALMLSNVTALRPERRSAAATGGPSPGRAARPSVP